MKYFIEKRAPYNFPQGRANSFVLEHAFSQDITMGSNI